MFLAGYIYVLLNPNNDYVFYVGSTVNPEARKSSHRNAPKSSKKLQQAPVSLYCKENNIRPIFQIIERVYSSSNDIMIKRVLLAAREIEQINEYKNIGYELVNIYLNKKSYGRIIPKSIYNYYIPEKAFNS